MSMSTARRGSGRKRDEECGQIALTAEGRVYQRVDTTGERQPSGEGVRATPEVTGGVVIDAQFERPSSTVTGVCVGEIVSYPFRERCREDSMD